MMQDKVYTGFSKPVNKTTFLLQKKRQEETEISRIH